MTPRKSTDPKRIKEMGDLHQQEKKNQEKLGLLNKEIVKKDTYLQGLYSQRKELFDEEEDLREAKAELQALINEEEEAKGAIPTGEGRYGSRDYVIRVYHLVQEYVYRDMSYDEFKKRFNEIPMTPTKADQGPLADLIVPKETEEKESEQEKKKQIKEEWNPATDP